MEGLQMLAAVLAVNAVVVGFVVIAIYELNKDVSQSGR